MRELLRFWLPVGLIGGLIGGVSIALEEGKAPFTDMRAVNNPTTQAIVISVVIGCSAIMLITIGLVAFVQRMDPTLDGRLKRHFGRNYSGCQHHEKSFPGYDLVSLNRALMNVLDKDCARIETVGTIGYLARTRDVMATASVNPNLQVQSATYERLPVDVAEEESVVSACLFLVEFRAPRPGGSSDGRSANEDRTNIPSKQTLDLKAAVQIHVVALSTEYDDGMDHTAASGREVIVSIACWSKEVADFFFRELEERRRRLSIYRGKVIDPVIGSGGIQKIGFRRIKHVAKEDLILPESVTDLLDSSIIGFYDHVETLRQVGVELKRGIILYGPPGTGKTSISLYLAGLLPDFTVCFVSGDRLMYPRELCRMARYLQPTMLVFEDIDLVAEERNINRLATVLGELMNQIDGCEPDDQVLFLMNTNSMDRLENAVKNRPGRVDQVIEVPLPADEERRKLLHYFMKGVSFPGGDWKEIIEATDGASPAMLKEIVKRAVVLAIQRLGSNGAVKQAAPNIELSKEDLLLATEQVRTWRDDEPGTNRFGFAKALRRTGLEA